MTPKSKAVTARETVKTKFENPFPIAQNNLSDIDEELPADEYPTLDLNLGFKNFSNQIGDRPGPIDNSEIEGYNKLSLRPNMMVN